MSVTLAGGAIVLGLSLGQVAFAGLSAQALLLAAVTLTFSAIGTISIPGVKIKLTVSDGFILTAVILLGVPAAVLLAFADAYLASVKITRSRFKRGFNAAAMGLSIFISAHLLGLFYPVFYTLRSQALSASEIIFPIGVLGLLHYLFNSSLVSTAVALRTGRPVMQMWREDLLWTSVSYFGGASVAGVVYLLISVAGFYTFIIAVPIVIITYFTYKTYLDKVATSRQQAARLEELFAKVSKGKREWEVTFDTLSEAIYIFDEAGRLIRVNTAGQRLESRIKGTACPITDLPGTPAEELGLLGGAEAQEHFIRAQAGQEVNCERGLREAGGDWLDLAVTATAIEFDVFQEQSALVVVARDTTEQKRLREQLLQAEKMSAVGELVAGVAHELNNPLTTVIGFSQLLQMSGNLEGEDRQDLQLIIGEAERARGIVANLLTFARQHHSEKASVNLNEVIEKVLLLRGYSLRTNNIMVETLLDEALPPTLANFHQLQQVLLNVIVNAEQAMTEYRRGGNLTLGTQVQGGRIVVTVADDGPGITQSHLTRIFDPFFTTKPQGKGTGLGLSISYGIIQEHGGEIAAASAAGQGTTFTITLPLLECEEELPAAGETASVAAAALRVLVVDDEPGILRTVERALTQAGHACDTTDNVDAALDLLQRQTYDLILSDVRMADKDGEAFYHEALQRDGELADRFLFMTGDAVAPKTSAFLNSINASYLSKPFNVEDLIVTVNSRAALDLIPEPPAALTPACETA